MLSSLMHAGPGLISSQFHVRRGLLMNDDLCHEIAVVLGLVLVMLFIGVIIGIMLCGGPCR